MVGIYFLQLIVAAILGIKRFPFAALLVPLIVCTIVFHWFVSSVFKRPWTLTSVREAAMLDEREGAVSGVGWGGGRGVRGGGWGGAGGLGRGA